MLSFWVGLLPLLLCGVATQAIYEYVESEQPASQIQLCLITGSCLTPECAVCTNTTTPAFNVSLVKMGKVVYAQIPRIDTFVPPETRLDSIRLVDVIPEAFRFGADRALTVTQQVGIGCDDGTTFRKTGKISLAANNGTLEIAWAALEFSSRVWPMSNTTCGTLSAIGMNWML